jgi:ankyrin repeat protein
MMAALSGNGQILRDALERGISPNEPGPDGNTASHFAVMRLNLYLLGVLQDAKADLTITNDAQVSALDLLKNDESVITERRTLDRAVRANDIKGIEQYLADTEPADAAKQFNKLMTSLALLRLKPATISHLLKRGADPNHRNRDGVTPLIQAAAIDDEAMVTILLGAGADKTARDNKGRLAVDRTKSETVKALLR